MKLKRVYTEEQKARRNRQWRESRLRCGHATLCPVCGSWTKSRNGFCKRHGGLKSIRPPRSTVACSRCGRPMPDGSDAKVLMRVRWEWDAPEDGELWESGWLLSHGVEPHSPALYGRGRWVLSDGRSETEIREDR